MFKMKNSFFIFLLFFSIPIFGQNDSLRQSPHNLNKEVTVNIKLNYLLYLPPKYDDNDKKWPLVLFLHGAGERGDDLNLVKRNGPPMLIEKGTNFPFILVSPQCPLGQRWDALELSTLLDDVEGNYHVDTNRIYVTGLSMGGEGTWKIILAEPNRFAAAAPVCGRTGSSYLDACKLKNLPIWVFHGAMDDVVSIEESVRMVKALENCGNDVRFTVYPKANHNSWTETYNNQELYEWLLEKSLQSK
jgi:predicted peptidase